jgi:hypothetical protein
VAAERMERWVRPLAAYGLASAVPLWLLMINMIIHPGLVGWVNANVNAVVPVTRIWAATAVLSMFAALLAAVRILVHDPELEPRTRRRWAVVVAVTTLIGGSLFILWRWRTSRRAAGR